MHLMVLLIALAVNTVDCKSAISDFYNQSILTTIAFGSCSKHLKPQKIWRHITGHKPDLFIWLGDVVYSDRRVAPFVFLPNSIEVVEEMYHQFYNHPEYKKFRNSGIKIIGVWDDHDYGQNNGDKTLENRLQTQNIFLNFMEVPINNKMRKKEGIYVSYYFGTGNRTVKLILLDTRSFLDPEQGDILGQEQWNWLQEQLNEDATLTIIGSSIQVLSDIPFVDRWRYYQKSFDRLMWLIKSKPRVIMLSGDVHFGEIACLNTSWIGYPLYDITSSGLSHTCSFANLPTSFCLWVLRTFVISKYRINDVYGDLNFGLVRLNWTKSSVEIVLEVYGLNGLELQQRIELDDLNIRDNPAKCPQATVRPTDYMKLFGILLGAVVILTPLTLLSLACWFSSKLYKRMFLFKNLNDDLTDEPFTKKNI